MKENTHTNELKIIKINYMNNKYTVNVNINYGVLCFVLDFIIVMIITFFVNWIFKDLLITSITGILSGLVITWIEPSRKLIDKLIKRNKKEGN